MDSLEDDFDLSGEMPPTEGFDSFIYDEPSFIEDELQNVSETPNDFQPPGHCIMPELLKYAQEKAREDVCETAMELSYLNATPSKLKETSTPKKKALNPMNFTKHLESLNRAYGDYVKNKKFETSRKRVKEFEDYLETKGMCHDDSAKSEGGTPKLFKDMIIEYMNDQNVDRIINTAPIDFTHRSDPSVTPLLTDPKLQLIIEDSYFPGVIDDAVNRKLDFNTLAFDMTYGPNGPPEELDLRNSPPTLLESFEKRVELENMQRQQRLKKIHDKTPDIRKDCSKIGGFMEFLKKRDESFKINRDEVMISTTVDVDLNASLRTTPENDLTRAITCLQKAQMMNSYDKSIEVAELAYVEAPDDLAESAAIIKTNSFIAHVSEQKSSIEPSASIGQYRPIEIVSYLGVTEPLPCDIKIPKLDLKIDITPPRPKVSPVSRLQLPKAMVPPRKPMGPKGPSNRLVASKIALNAIKIGGSCPAPRSKQGDAKCAAKPVPKPGPSRSRVLAPGPSRRGPIPTINIVRPSISATSLSSLSTQLSKNAAAKIHQMYTTSEAQASAKARIVKPVTTCKPILRPSGLGPNVRPGSSRPNVTFQAGRNMRPGARTGPTLAGRAARPGTSTAGRPVRPGTAAGARPNIAKPVTRPQPPTCQ